MTKSTVIFILFILIAALIPACQKDSIVVPTTSEELVIISIPTPKTSIPWGRGVIQQVVWSPDGKHFAVAGSLGGFLYSADTHELARFIETESWVLSIIYSPDGDMLASGHKDGFVHLWDATSGELLSSLEGHSEWVISLAFSKDGNNIASGSWDNTVRVWNSLSGKLIHTLKGHTDGVNSVDFNSLGTVLASTGSDGTIRLWDVETGELIQNIEVNESPINCVIFAGDNHTLVSGHGDHTIRVWDTTTGENIQTLGGHTQEVRSVALSPDGQTMASASSDQTIRIWDLKTGKTIETLEEHRGDLINVAFNPDGSLLASATWSEVHIWEIPGGRLQDTIVGHNERLSSLAFNPQGTIIASGAADGRIYLWQVATGDLIRTIEVSPSNVQSIAYFSDGQRLISGDSEGDVSIWDVSSGQLINTFTGHTKSISSVAISTDEHTMASGSFDETIRLWDVDSGEHIRTLEGHDLANYVAFSPDGQMMVSAGWDQDIFIWEVNSGKLHNRLRGHRGIITSVEYSHDGLLIASSGWDNTVKLWDPGTGLLIQTLEGHTKPVIDVTFSPDGRVIASASWDGTIKLWETGPGNLLGTLGGDRGSFNDVTFDIEGRTLASGGASGRIYLWDLENILETMVLTTQTVDETESSLILGPSQVVGIATPTPALTPQSLSTQGPWLLYTLEDENDVEYLWVMNSDGTGASLLDFGPFLWNLSRGVSKVGGESHIVVPVGVDKAEYIDAELVIYQLGSEEIRKRIRLLSSEFIRKIEGFEYDDEYQWVYDPIFAASRSMGDYMWSPNGLYLAFTAVIDGPSGDIYVYDLQTNAVRRLTSGSNQAALIDWSPDSRWIIHSEWVNGRSSFVFPEPKVQTVWAVAADGNGLRRLYDLSWYATAEISLGWLTDEVFVVESKDTRGLPLPHSHLRTVNLETGEVVSIHEDVFEGATLDSETGVIILAKTMANGGMEGLFRLERDSWELVELFDVSGYVDPTTSGLAYAFIGPDDAEEGRPGYFLFDSDNGVIVTFPDEDYKNNFAPSPDGRLLAFNGCTISTQQCGVRIYDRNGVLLKAINITKSARYMSWASDSSKIWFSLPRLLYSYRIADDKITLLRNDLPNVLDLVLVEK